MRAAAVLGRATPPARHTSRGVAGAQVPPGSNFPAWPPQRPAPQGLPVSIEAAPLCDPRCCSRSAGLRRQRPVGKLGALAGWWADGERFKEGTDPKLEEQHKLNSSV